MSLRGQLAWTDQCDCVNRSFGTIAYSVVQSSEK